MQALLRTNDVGGGELDTGALTLIIDIIIIITIIITIIIIIIISSSSSSIVIIYTYTYYNVICYNVIQHAIVR